MTEVATTTVITVLITMNVMLFFIVVIMIMIYRPYIRYYNDMKEKYLSLCKAYNILSEDHNQCIQSFALIRGEVDNIRKKLDGKNETKN